MPTSLPSGTVTFLFSDVEGSTRLLQALGGERFAAALGAHQALLRAAWAAHGGVEISTEGDSFFVAFASAPAAVAAAAQATAALAAHSWPAGVKPVRVRLGLHTGVPALAGETYIGLDVHRAARIAATAAGGQVVLSEATFGLVGDLLPPGASLRDLGEHLLKDLQRPEHLYQLILPALPADFPPLRTLDHARHNLPVQPTPLVGRSEAVRQVVALLERPGGRLVTLTGPGGIGKTRLALHVAAELVEAFPDGVYFVPLAQLSDPEQVPSAIAHTLEIRDAGSANPYEALRLAVAAQRLLLVLDNLEQVVGAAPRLAQLLESAPALTLLVTSRIPLHLRGEQEYAVGPLALPAVEPAASAHHTPPTDLATLTQYAAVALFIERARAARADFQVTTANAAAIAEICARLDGLPLAIELAAARVKLLPPQAMLSRLSRRLKLLTGGARDLPERQQTLQSAIGWSYDLLSPDERMLFRRLAVFAAGWTIEGAEAVCAAPVGAAPLELDVLDGLGSLVDKSLVRQAEGAESEPRFSLLETIREYGLEQLEAAGEASTVRDAHLAAMVAFAEEAYPFLRAPEGPAWLARVARAYDDTQAALAWARERGDSANGLRLAGALAEFWHYRGLWREGRGWVDGFLAAAGAPAAAIGTAEGAPWEHAPGTITLPAASWARALYATGLLAVWQGDREIGLARLEAALPLAAAAGDWRTEADSHNALGVAHMYVHDRTYGESHFAALLSLSRAHGDTYRMAGALNNLAMCARDGGQDDHVRQYLEEAMALAQQVGSKHVLSVIDFNLATLSLRQGALGDARRLLRDSLRKGLEVEAPVSVARGLQGAAATVVAAISSSADGTMHGDPSIFEQSAQLWGAASQNYEMVGASAFEQDDPGIVDWRAKTRALLGEERWAAAFAAGRALPQEQAAAMALDALAE